MKYVRLQNIQNLPSIYINGGKIDLNNLNNCCGKMSQDGTLQVLTEHGGLVFTNMKEDNYKDCTVSEYIKSNYPQGTEVFLHSFESEDLTKRIPNDKYHHILKDKNVLNRMVAKVHQVDVTEGKLKLKVEITINDQSLFVLVSEKHISKGNPDFWDGRTRMNPNHPIPTRFSL